MQRGNHLYKAEEDQSLMTGQTQRANILVIMEAKPSDGDDGAK